MRKDPRTPSRAPMWVVDPQVLGLLSAAQPTTLTGSRTGNKAPSTQNSKLCSSMGCWQHRHSLTRSGTTLAHPNAQLTLQDPLPTQPLCRELPRVSSSHGDLSIGLPDLPQHSAAGHVLLDREQPEEATVPFMTSCGKRLLGLLPYK